VIALLKGIVAAYGDDTLVLDVQGVGYELHCSSRTLTTLPSVGEPATIHVETVVREDMIRLYGFQSPLEKSWFGLLTTVQGVGAKVGLAILSTLSPGDLATAIAMQDKAMVARAPGVGPKVAARIVSELRDKAPAMTGGEGAGFAAVSGALSAGAPSASADAVSALVNLGYPQAQAGAAVASALREAGDDASPETLIRLGLKELAR
jgi:Holliday junction DNA helicase RuvA